MRFSPAPPRSSADHSVIGALAAFGGCERHSWEETSRLHQAHGGDHGDGHEKTHDAGHDKADDTSHDKDAAAHSKKDEHPEPKAKKKDAEPEAEKPKGEPRKL